MFSRYSYFKFFIFDVLFFIAPLACAFQLKTAAENQTIYAKISARELTRIYVVGDRIQSTHGITESYQLTKDTRQGAIFIKPASSSSQPIQLFLTTEQGRNFILHLTPFYGPANTIALRPNTVAKEYAAHWEKNTAYSELILTLLHAMVSGVTPEGYAVTEHDAKVHCERNHTILNLKTIYQGDHLRGEVWQLKNVSHESLTLLPIKNYFAACTEDKNAFLANVRALAWQDPMAGTSHDAYLYRIIGGADYAA